MIEITTLGRTAIIRNGVPLSVPADGPGFLLLVLLSLEGPTPLEKVSRLLWPDNPEEDRDEILRGALSGLERSVGPGVVTIQEGRLQVDPGRVVTDVERFREAISGGRARDALLIYRGPFLEEVDISLFPELTKWVEETRRNLAEMARWALEDQPWQAEPERGVVPRVLEQFRSRKVLQVGFLYLGFAWGSLEVCNVLVERGLLTDAAFLLLLSFHVVGLPLALTLAWVLEEPVRELGSQEESHLDVMGRHLAASRVQVSHLFVVLSVLALASVVSWGFLRWAGEETRTPAWAGLPEERHIAVLPFHPVGEDASARAFADGLMESLTSTLTQIEGLRGTLWVVPSAEIRRSGVTSAAEARREFGVSLTLSGSVRLASDSVEVTANLVDAVGLRQLRSFVLHESLASAGLLQTGILSGVRSLLDVELEEGERAALESGRTTNPEAYGFQVQGRGYLLRYEREDNLEHAIALFHRALEHDPEYVLALAGLGEAHLRRYELNREPAELERGREAVEEALRLDDGIAAVHITMGLIHSATGRHEEAKSAFERARELEPHSAEALLGTANALRDMGEIAEAEAHLRRAVELRPGYWGGHNQLGVFFTRLGRYEEAATQFRRVVALTPDNARGWANLGATYFSLGQLEEALDAFQRSVSINPSAQGFSNLGTLLFYADRFEAAAEAYRQALALNERSFRAWNHLAFTYRHLSQPERAREAHERAAEMARSALELNPRDPEALLALAAAYAFLGQPDRTRSLLRQALEAGGENVEVLFVAGDIYEEIGDRENAIRWIGEALRRGYPTESVERARGLEDLRADPRIAALMAEADGH